MTHLEYQAHLKLDKRAKMATVWRTCAAAIPHAIFAGLTIDYQNDGAVQIPTVYIILKDCTDKAAEESRLRPLVDETIEEVRRRFGSLKRKELYSDRDVSIGHFDDVLSIAIKVYTESELLEIKAAAEREKFRQSPGKNIAALHPAEVSSIDNYSPEEFHVFYRTDAVCRASAANGLSATIERELIEYCHQIGQTNRTPENTRILFSSLEELGGDYIGFYR